MKEKIKKILDNLKDSVDNPINTEVDRFTEEAYDVPNYFCLDPTTNDCKVLYDYITNLLKANEELNSIINKTTEYIIDNCVLSDEWKDLGFCNFIPTGRIEYKQLSKTKVKYLLKILKGDKDE